VFSESSTTVAHLHQDRNAFRIINSCTAMEGHKQHKSCYM